MRVLILGANGSIAREATKLVLDKTDVELTLYLRDPRRLRDLDRARVVQGDVLDAAALAQAMAGQDVVYAGSPADLERMAESIVKAMSETGVRRPIFISSMGIYDEVPGQQYSSVLDPYRKAAEVIEASRLHDPKARVVHECGRGRLRDHPEGRGPLARHHAGPLHDPPRHARG